MATLFEQFRADVARFVASVEQARQAKAAGLPAGFAEDAETICAALAALSPEQRRGAAPDVERAVEALGRYIASLEAERDETGGALSAMEDFGAACAAYGRIRDMGN